MKADFDFLGRADVGLIRVGMTRDEVRSVLEGPCDEFFKSADAEVPTDAYDELGIHVYFDGGLAVVGVEFLKWAQLVWRGQRLVGAEAQVVQQFLAGQGQVLELNNSGFNVENLGLRFYAPDIGEDGAIVEAVYVDFTSPD